MANPLDVLDGNPAIITAEMMNGFKNVTIKVEGVPGIATLWDLIDYVSRNVNQGSGIYSGSGTVPTTTFATLAGGFTMGGSQEAGTSTSRLFMAKSVALPVRLEHFEVDDPDNWAGIQANINGATQIAGGLTGIILITAKVKDATAKNNSVILLDSTGAVDHKNYTMPEDTPAGLALPPGNYVWQVDQDGNNGSWVDISTLVNP